MAGAPRSLRAGQPDVVGARSVPDGRNSGIGVCRTIRAKVVAAAATTVTALSAGTYGGAGLSAGLLWGWLPCGLVYSALITALSSGSALRGAGMMLAFGAGTLPNLLLAGLLAARLNEYAAKPVVRISAGLLVAAFGLWGLSRVVRVAGSF